MTPLKDAEAGHHDSVPRLEIQAVRLAAEVAAEVNREVGAGKYERVVFWVDSECVLKQLHDSRTRFKMYFANRISIILGLSKVQQWRKVPTELNPADDCSRGLGPSDPKWRRFHQGPEFLRMDEAEWPPQVVLTQPLSAAVMAVVAAPVPEVTAPLVTSHWVLRVAASASSWQVKLRRISVILRFAGWVVSRWRERKGGGGGSTVVVRRLSLLDLKQARVVLLRAVQERAFGEEMRCLRAGGPIGRRSPIGSLCPFLDGQGLLRCGGRLARAERLSFDSRFPVILPHGSSEIQDFLRHLHTSLLHAGVDQVLGESRRWAWITRGRREVQKVVAGCVPCQRLFKQPESQQMAALPVERVTIGAPFAATGVDCFGPMRVKIAGRAYHKVWVALFTCLATRAVHFEVLRDMSASSFLDSFVQFRARRPGVRKLFSDNGSNFVAADKEMRREVEAWNAATTEELQLQGVEWSFTPPASPHRGGVWERLVRSAKKHLAFLLHEENVHIETFTTVLAKVCSQHEAVDAGWGRSGRGFRSDADALFVPGCVHWIE